MLPYFHAPVFHTEAGTPYLKQPGVVLIGMPFVDLRGVQGFLDGFDPDLKFGEYLQDPDKVETAPEALVKFSGQLCYASFSEKRTWNKDVEKYINHIKESGHGSVLEHANFNFLLYGISRSVTHELVRHRAGTGFSQLSQRYAEGTVVRYVERPEWQDDPELHKAFEDRIDRASKEYEYLAEKLTAKQAAGDPMMSGKRRTDLKKKVRQAARACLPNETEAPIVFSGNARALRHTLEMRASMQAEVEIRSVFMFLYRCLKTVSPGIFGDYEVEQLVDGTCGLKTKYRKV